VTIISLVTRKRWEALRSSDLQRQPNGKAISNKATAWQRSRRSSWWARSKEKDACGYSGRRCSRSRA
ncbi:unnamed protein product, partial [Amoebophrya sp. A25]